MKTTVDLSKIKGSKLKTQRPAVNVNLELAKKNAADYKAESDRLNTFRSKAWETTNGIPGAMVGMAGQAVRHPLRTAGLIGQGVGNGLVIDNVNALSSYAGIPKIPRLNVVRPRNNVESGIEHGFNVGGMAGSFMAGNAALRPLLESKRVVSGVSRLMPSAVSTIGKSTKMKPFAQGLVADQILTQAFMDRDSSFKDRAVNAAIAPVASLGFHALGRGGSLAATRVKEAIGKNRKELTNIDLSTVNDKDLAKYQKMKAEVDSPIVDPKTGKIDEAAMVKRASGMSKFEETLRAKASKLAASTKKYHTSTRRVLQDSGESGKKFASVMDELGIQEPMHRAFRKAQLNSPAFTRIVTAYNNGETAAWNRVQQAQVNPAKRSALQSTDEKETFMIVNKMMRDAHAEGVKKGWTVTLPDGSKKPWDPSPEAGDTYWPHYFDKKVADDAMHRKYQLEGLMKSGMSRVEAEASLDSQATDSIFLSKIGNFERPRIQHDPRFRTGPDVMFDYADDWAKMSARSDLLGQGGEKVNDLVEGMLKDGIEMKDIQRVLNEKFGASSDVSPIIQALLKYNQFTKLPLSFFSNLTQVANTATSAGWGNTFKALWKYARSAEDRKFMEDFSREAGALDDLNITSEAGVAHGKFMNVALYLFKKVEEFNRIISSGASREYFKELVDIIKKDPTNGIATRGLKGLGIDANKVLRKGFKLNESDFARAANNFVGNTQFHINAMNLPLWSRKPYGKLFTQFKSFGFMQTKFYRDFVYEEAKNGNYMPLFRAMAAVPPLYFAAKAGRDITTFRDPELRNALGLSVKEKDERQEDQETFEAMMAMTGTLPAQLLKDFNYTAYNAFGGGSEYKSPIAKTAIVAGNLFGPTVSDIGGFLGSMEKSGDMADENRFEDPEDKLDTTYPLKRYALGWVPYVGQGLKNVFFKDWPEREREKYRANMEEGLRTYFDTKDKNILNEITSSLETKEQVDIYKDVRKEIAREKNMTPEEKQMYENIQARKKAINKLPLLNQ